jgi:hypothetical protein
MYHPTMDVDSDEWLGCGVDGHEPECLCDVHLEGRTSQVNVRDMVADMWMGEDIVALRGYGVDGWTDEDIITYLEDILRVRDGWSESALEAHTISEQRTEGVGGNNASPMGEWADMRNHVRTMIASGTYGNISDTLDAVGVTAQQFTASATSHKYSFDIHWLMEFERAVTERQCASIAELASRFGITPKVARNLWAYWGTPLKEVTSYKPSVVMVREMLTDGCGVDEIVATVYAKLGVQITRSSVHKTASRMRKGG